ncbi:hypothetical protein GGU11DRAFT_282299 [Lentinula aff. detonsa]|uniref:Uncharacterized protein n=1 Tax=Lentinula aff. detonsa TaxID=2804958 RepID=A0AA38KE79_9AGAR|nr:hypothetical protein GGU10DRAFT_364259 [Lentinula aff. detonsa]KAJ3794727.1 hypothetical protein GGU11DRAFT_282299 [Lentinula aff. detonsa]
MRFNPAYLFVLGSIPATLCLTLNVRSDMRSYVGPVETPETRAFHQDHGMHLLAARADRNAVHLKFMPGVEGNEKPPPKVLPLVTKLFMTWLGVPLIIPEFVNQLSEVLHNGELIFHFWGSGLERCKESSDGCSVIIGAVIERNQWITIHKGARYLYSTTTESLAVEPLA